MHRRRLHPRAPAAGVHGTVPPGPPRMAGCANPDRGALPVRCWLPWGPGSDVHPRVQLRLRGTRPGKFLTAVADLALDEGEVEGHRKGEAGEQAHHEEDP